MKNFLIGLICGLTIVGVAWAGTRVETSFTSFSVCVIADQLSAGVNRIVVSGGVLLDTGDPSRNIGRNVLSQLNGPQKAAAVSFFNSALGVVGTSQQIATPTGLPTP